jgi:hypothetical protein
MCIEDVELKPVHWGIRPQVSGRLFSCVLAGVGALASQAAADPITIVPDPPARTRPAIVAPAGFRATSDLDGFYVWLGPIGAAGYLDATWDSVFGAEATIGRVREQAGLALVGVNLGASRWTRRDGGRIWLDGVVGTRVYGHMMGASLGPFVELSELSRPRFGAAVGVWGHAGIAPFVRVGGASELGMFAELGIHIALPVVHR